MYIPECWSRLLSLMDSETNPLRYLCVAELSPDETGMFVRSIAAAYTGARAAGPQSFDTPEFYTGFMDRFAELLQLIEETDRVKEPTTDKRFVIDISSPPNRQKLVADIMFGDRSYCEQWAELNVEDGTLRIEFYPRRDGRFWEFSFGEVMDALNQAERATHRIA